jgi:hypothetical protein
MRTSALILLIVAATLQQVPASAQDAKKLSSQEQLEASAKKVKELQQQRIETLKQALEETNVLYRTARVEYGEVVDAQVQLIEAELEVAESDADRIKLYQNMVDMLKSYEQVADDLAKRAQGTHVAGLKVKARRLEAEIHLEQAKAKAAEASK